MRTERQKGNKRMLLTQSTYTGSNAKEYQSPISGLRIMRSSLLEIVIRIAANNARRKEGWYPAGPSIRAEAHSAPTAVAYITTKIFNNDSPIRRRVRGKQLTAKL